MSAVSLVDRCRPVDVSGQADVHFHIISLWFWPLCGFLLGSLSAFTSVGSLCTDLAAGRSAGCRPHKITNIELNIYHLSLRSLEWTRDVSKGVDGEIKAEKTCFCSLSKWTSFQLLFGFNFDAKSGQKGVGLSESQNWPKRK